MILILSKYVYKEYILELLNFKKPNMYRICEICEIKLKFKTTHNLEAKQYLS